MIKFLYALSLFSICTTANAEALKLNNPKNPWFQEAAVDLQKRDARLRKPPAKRGGAKNIILFVGDGMGVSTVTAARILAGQLKGKSGEEHQLSFEKFDYTGLSKTYNVDAQTPDSAGTMTAIMTGVKTDAGIIGLAEGVERGRCASQEGQSLTSLLQIAELAGMSTGIVTTSRVTHATPAATYASSPERNWENSSALPSEAKAAGCEDIAAQLISFSNRLREKGAMAGNGGVDIVLGGGRAQFLPLADGGLRSDNRNLIEEWKNLYPGSTYIRTRKQLKKLKAEHQGPILGLFNDSHLSYQSQRKKEEPSLTLMTKTAIKQLKKNPKGYFLMVEGARIDHAHHSGNAYNALHDTIELSKAVAVAKKLTDPKDTLIIVTADHSHVFTIAGYPKRGNPILGNVVGVGQQKPATSLMNTPYTTLGYTNGPGYRSTKDLLDKQHSEHAHSKHYRQVAAVPLASETHGAEDVAIYAQGPGAHLVSGTMEQNQIFHVMEFAGDLIRRASSFSPSSAKSD